MTNNILKACSVRVKAGASMVRGLSRYRPCEGTPVFKNKFGDCFCASHAVGDPDYVPAAKKEKKSWLVFYTNPDGSKSRCYVWEAVSERGAKTAAKRTHPGITVDGVVEYHGDYDFEHSAGYEQWKEYWRPVLDVSE